MANWSWRAIGEPINSSKIQSFQESVAKSYIAHLKENISSSFSSSHKVVPALAIFNPRKAPSADSASLSSYGNESIKILLEHCGLDKPAQTVLGEEMVKPALISAEVKLSGKPFVHC